MDELFQRASENYPLQNGKDDWERIAKRIADDSDDNAAVSFPGSKKDKKIIALIIALFFLLAGWIVFQKTLSATLSATTQSKPAKGMDLYPSGPLNKKNDVNNSSNEAVEPVTHKKNKEGKAVLLAAINPANNVTVAIIEASPNSNNYIGIAGELNQQALTDATTGNYDNTSFPVQSLKDSTGNRYLKNQTGNNASISEKLKPVVPDPGQITGSKKESDEHVNSKKELATFKLKKKGVYFGLVSGIDFSKVQSRPFNNAGFIGGVIAGYKTKSKFSVETGIIWNGKNYSSEGSSFHMDKVRSSMPYGMTINNLKSQIALIEIPLKARYNLIETNNAVFFALAGVSAYIMTNEKNKYNVTTNGNPEKMTGTYDKNSYGLPAVANISIGYEHKVSPLLGIRIEPFVKIPLKGIGIGSLPVTSAGLQVGIISRLK
ncbi:MAG: outer membrane beta-barrel protein [Ferruginibacter sp.]